MNLVRIFATYILALAVGATLTLAIIYTWEGAPLPLKTPGAANRSLPPEFDRVGEAWSILSKEHIDHQQLDPQTLSDGAIRGMMQALEDPYASYLDARKFNEEAQEMGGFFEGIGAQVGIRDARLMIISPLPNSPAEKAGIRSGDVILTIDGEDAHDFSLMDAVSRIRGPEGTTVELLVQHLNESEPVLIPVVRGVIPLETVHFEMLPDGIGHMRISSFAQNTNEQVEQVLEEFRAADGRALIVDLRNNFGGLLSSVVDVTGQFLDQGGLVTYELDAQGKRRDWRVSGEGKAQDVPMVLLVNQFSASASEVFAGAIIDYRRAPVVGQTSFGKGSVNTMRGLSDGSGIFFTIARWYTPNGALIEGSGITPTHQVEMPADAPTDIQLEWAVNYLKQQGPMLQTAGNQANY